VREAHDQRPSTPCLIPPRGQGLEEGVKEATERVAQLARVVSLSQCRPGPFPERSFGKRPNFATAPSFADSCAVLLSIASSTYAYPYPHSLRNTQHHRQGRRLQLLVVLA